jgi:hypothetical protein
MGSRHHIKAISTSVDPAKIIKSSQHATTRSCINYLQDGNAAKEIRMTDYRVSQGEVQEDQITAAIEKVTAQVPSSAYLALALGSMAVSVGFQAAKKPHSALFVGQWAAPFLILGIYNKLVKLHGSDGTTHA